VLVEQAHRFPDHEALVFDDPFLDGRTVRVSYREVEQDARHVARALLAIGLGKGARVGILMGNRPEAVVSLFGAALAGAIAVPISTLSPKPELAYLLAHADISVILSQTTMGRRRFADDIAELCPAATFGRRPIADLAYPYLRNVAVVGPEGDCAGLETWDDFIRRGEAIDDALVDAVAAQVHPSDPAFVIYTSGTTSAPKGVLHNHQAGARQWWVQADLFGRDPATRVWCAMPLFWTAGMNAALGATIASGGTWVMQEMFETGPALRLLERERVTEPHVFGHQAKMLEGHPDWAKTDLSSCTKVFGKSVFTRHSTVQADPTWNMPVGYGMSETSSFFTGLPHTAPRDVFRTGTYGRLLPGNEMRVIDPDTGKALGPDQDGELVVRGPTLMEHYVKRTRAECFDADGYYHTGDIGRYDDHGFVYWAGRRTEMVKTAGANVSPAEIEVQLQAFEPVKLARAVGVPDDDRDEIVVLCVELKDGATATEGELKAFLRERIASYKVPRHVLFFSEGEIPMNNSRTKVKDDALVTEVAQRLGR
jgi:acyl-CoA synthetase (AMP-forming)/AMP-acid ligase II